jgi:hypothetical protein
LEVQGVPTEAKPERDITVTLGFHDPRYGVKLDPGFTIFRNYLGKDYQATAVQGFWVLGHTGVGYGTLNELSNAIGITHENAWANWFYRDENGKRRPLSDLRDQSKIQRRRRLSAVELMDRI